MHNSTVLFQFVYLRQNISQAMSYISANQAAPMPEEEQAVAFVTLYALLLTSLLRPGDGEKALTGDG